MSSLTSNQNFPCCKPVPVVPRGLSSCSSEDSLAPPPLQPHAGGGEPTDPCLSCAPPGLFTPSLYLSLIHYILSKEFRGQLIRLLMCVSSPPCSPPAINHLQVTIIDGSRAITPHSAIPGDKSNRAFGWPQKYFLPA